MTDAELWPFAEPGRVSALERRWLLDYYGFPFRGPDARAKTLGFASRASRPARALETRMRVFVAQHSQREAALWALLEKRYREKPNPWPLPASAGVHAPGLEHDRGETRDAESPAATSPASGGKNGLALFGGRTALPTRETVLLRIENMHGLLEEQAQRAIYDKDPVLAQSAIKGMMETLKELAKGVGANKAVEPEPPSFPVFLGVPREEWDNADQMWRRTYRNEVS